jgi:hypothetical protein
MAQQIQLRNDSTTAWETENPVLAQAEIGVDTTTKQFKIGDGTSTWTELDYYANEDLKLPTSIKDANGNDLIVFEKGDTGVARIHAVQDDLALRSARDIILYPGDDGPGKVYINWGDATISPNATNEVATIGYVQDAVNAVTGLDGVVTQTWGYPTGSSKAIRPLLAGEAIALKSSQSTAIRWHVRENSPSVVISPLIPSAAVVTATGDGDYFVDFTINTQDYAPTTSEHYYNVFAPNSVDYDGNFYPVSSTTTSLRLRYPTDPGTFNATNASIAQPSVYSQFEVNEDGAFVKIANWSDGPGGYSQSWHFTNNGSIHFPFGPSNSRTGSGDVLRFDESAYQAIISGPPSTSVRPDAQRLVIAGSDGYSGSTGEGGDIYLWAGVGGDAGGTGGDIKVDAGNGSGSGEGGTIKVRGGYSQTGTGGFVDIYGGDSYTQNGGQINIRAGQNSTGTGGGGQVYIQGGYSADPTLGGAITITTFQSAPITISGAGGEFLNDPAVPDNQIATHGYVATAKNTYPRILATDGPTPSLTHVGCLLYANLNSDNPTYVVPTDATLTFPIGSEIKFAGADTSGWIISAADTEAMTIIGENGAGYYGTNYNFFVPANSTATLLKVDDNRWILSGLRLTD